MSKTLDLYTHRLLQITLVFVILAWLDQYGHIPYSSWIIVTGAVIYAGFDAGTVLRRAYLRMLGTIIGIAAVAIVWHVVHFDYRLYIFFVVLITWMMIFSQILFYQNFVICATLFADLSVETSNSSAFLLPYYIADRFISTGIAFSVCIVIEQLWFGKNNLSVLTCRYLLKTIQQKLDELYTITKYRDVTRSTLFKEILSINQSIFRLRTIIADHQYEATNVPFYQNAELLVNQIIYDLRQIICLGYLKKNDQHNPAIAYITAQVEEKLINNE